MHMSCMLLYLLTCIVKKQCIVECIFFSFQYSPGKYKKGYMNLNISSDEEEEAEDKESKVDSDDDDDSDFEES